MNALLTVPQLAAKWKVGRRQLLRRLLALHAAHGGPWLTRVAGGSRGGWWRVNIALLRRAHPELFDHAHIRDLEERVTRLEHTQRGLRGRVATLERRAAATASAAAIPA